MEDDRIYFLKISGYVNAGKLKEFKQTVQYIINTMPTGRSEQNLALDVYDLGLYHFYSQWYSEDALRTFKASNDYEVLIGAFKALGQYKKSVWGKKSDLQLFELIYLDTKTAET